MTVQKLRTKHAILLLPVLLMALQASAHPPGSRRALEACRLCSSADELDGAAKTAQLDHALELAEQAIESDPGDAAAHFAVACNLGKKMQISGKNLLSLFRLRRLNAAIDRTLELAPDDSDSLAAKGTLLVELPRILGGNEDRGIALLKRALEVDPNQPDARRYMLSNRR